MGIRRTSAPACSRTRTKLSACPGARVTTMRFPARGWLALSNGSSREAQDSIRARFDENFSEMPPERFGIAGRAPLVAADEFRAVGRKYAGLEMNFATFGRTRPRSEGNLATAFEFVKKRAFGGHGSARSESSSASRRASMCQGHRCVSRFPMHPDRRRAA